MNHQGVMFTGRFWISSAGVGSEFLLFCQTPRWNQCCWSKPHTWRGNVLGGTRSSDEEKRGGAALGPRREISRKAMLGAVVQVSAPTSFPSPPGRGYHFPGLCICSEFWKRAGRKRKEGDCLIMYSNCLFSVASCISLWSRDSRVSQFPPPASDGTVQQNPVQTRTFFLPVVEVVEECWLKCFEEGKDRGVSSQRVLPPPFLPACQCWVLSCCPLAPQRPPLQGPSCSSSKYLSSPHPNIISSSITSKFSFSPQHRFLLVCFGYAGSSLQCAGFSCNVWAV